MACQQKEKKKKFIFQMLLFFQGFALDKINILKACSQQECAVQKEAVWSHPSEDVEFTDPIWALNVIKHFVVWCAPIYTIFINNMMF